MLGTSPALGHSPQCHEPFEPPWQGIVVAPEAQPDAAPVPCSLQGCGLHPLRDGHREASLPRLHGQGGAAPHLPAPRSVSCRSLPLTTRGRQNSVQLRRMLPTGRAAPTQSPGGVDLHGAGTLVASAVLSPRLTSYLAPPKSPLALASHPSPRLLISPGTPTEDTWPGVMALSEFRAYNFPRYLPQPLISHAPR